MDATNNEWYYKFSKTSSKSKQVKWKQETLQSCLGFEV